MACSCITDIDEKLADHRLDLAFMMEGRKIEGRPYSRLLRKDNGRPETRSGRPSLFAFSHCPWCGVRYVAEGQ